MSAPIETLQSDYPLRLATMGSFLLVDLYDPDADSTGDVMSAARDAADVMLDGGVPSVTFMIRVRRGSGLPNAHKREQMQRWLKRRGDQGAGIVWLEGEGFWAAAFRGLLSAFLLATGKRSILTIVASGDDQRSAAGLDEDQGRAVEAFYAMAHPAEAA